MYFRPVLFLLFLLFPLLTLAQDVPVRKIDKNTFTFSTADLVLIKDFEIQGPETHSGSKPYAFTIQALTDAGKPDTSINGNFDFAINDQLRQIPFKQGVATVEHPIGEAKELRVQYGQTNLRKIKAIEHTNPLLWAGAMLGGLLLLLFFYYIFRRKTAATRI